MKARFIQDTALFSKELQKTLNEIYLRLKLNNEMIDKSQDILLFSKQQNIELGTERYFDLIIDIWIQLTKIQKEILENIEIARTGLEYEIMM